MQSDKDMGVAAGAAPIDQGQAAAMGSDHSRDGIFVYHNCYRCQHGKRPCVQGGSHRCEFPHARND